MAFFQILGNIFNRLIKILMCITEETAYKKYTYVKSRHFYFFTKKSYIFVYNSSALALIGDKIFGLTY